MSGPLQHIGPYRIDRELGRGGMGVVSLAHDTRLDRKVAVKALPDHLATDPDRLARFEREARTLAQLNHPNIAQIYGVEEHDGRRYLVLEFVEGHTLAERIARGPMPVDEAIDIAAQIAEGVEAAHESGVVHRDLKPGNIIITPDGKAKVLDFGLARTDDAAPASASSMSPTLTSPAQGSPTIPGVILGTAAYMSPEQARGRRVDKRTDIWSFGVILYEMLTGASPFHGETVSDSIGAILHKPIDLERLPPSTPRSVRHVLQRSLQRDKSMRYRDIGDARLDLQLREPPGAELRDQRRPRGMPVLLAAFLLIVVGAGAWLVGGLTAPTGDSDSPAPMHIAIPKRMAGNPDGATTADFAVAHQTRRVVFIGQSAAGGVSQIYMRRIDEPEAHPLSGTEHAANLTVSPDGRTVLFTWNDPDGRRTELRRVSIDGGPVTHVLASDAGSGYDFTDAPLWLTPTTVLVSDVTRMRLDELSIESLTTTRLLDISDVIDYAAFTVPWSVVAGTRTIMTSVAISDPVRGPVFDVFALDLDDPKATRVLTNAERAVVFDGGRRIAFLRGKALSVARFDMASRAIVSDFMPLYSQIAHFEISPDGDLYYALIGSEPEEVRPIAIDTAGAREPLMERGMFLAQFVDVSPRGDALGLTTLPEPNGPPTAQILDIETGFMRPILDYTTVTGGPVWISDDAVSFSDYRSSARSELQMISGGDASTRRTIAPLGPEGGVQLLPAFSPDGQWMAYQFSPAFDSPARSLYLAPLDGEEPPRPIVQSGGVDSMPAFSPDGEWLAYASDSAGENRVVMQRFDTRTGALAPRIIPVSQGAGLAPVWSPDGSRLYFVDPDEGSLKRVAIEREPTLRIAPPEVVLTAAQLDGLHVVGPMSYDIFPSGDRFAFIEAPPDDRGEPPYINLTLNWLEELRTTMPID